MTPASFARVTSRGAWVPYPHLLLLDLMLCKLYSGEIKKLMVWMPPQHGKSELISRYFTPWILGNNPELCVALISYNGTIAQRWGRRARDLFALYGPTLFGHDISKSVHGAKEWELEGKRGGMVSVGIGGGLTGRPVDIAIIDDPIKDHVEAFSTSTREGHKQWWDSTMATRMSKEGRMVILQTRWHEDDLSGWLLKVEDDWVVLNLPALAYDPEQLPEKERAVYKGDPLGRAPGRPLCPHLKPLSFLKKRQKANAYFFAAMFQGRPTPLSGGIFQKKWFKIWAAEYLPVAYNEEDDSWFYPRHDKQFDEVISSWDFPKKRTEYGSYVVGQVWGRRGVKLFLLDQFRDRVTNLEMVEAVFKMKRKWPMMGATIIEMKAAGPEVKKAVEHRIPGIIGKIPVGSKEARASSVSYRVQAGNVLIPGAASVPWREDFIEELAGFPNGPYDDQVDSLTQALEYFEDRMVPEGSGEILTSPTRTNYSQFRRR